MESEAATKDMNTWLVIGALALLACGSWLSWYVGQMQDQIDRRYIDADDS